MTLINFIYLLGFLLVLYYLVILIFDFILRGFVPFITSRPWVVTQLNEELEKLKINNFPRFKAISIGAGRSGFFASLEKKYPEASLEGHEKTLLHYILSKIQAFVRRTKIKIKRSQHYHRVDVDNADLIYCYVSSSKSLRELGDKFKFECKQGTIIISNGFVIPFIEVKKIIELSDVRGRYSFLSKNRFLLKKNKRANKENKAYLYII